MSTRIALVSALFAASALSFGAANAADRNVKIVNKTKITMVAFYASNVGTDGWEEDILGQDVLEPRKSLQINIDDGTGACLFDFRADFEDGDSVVQRKVNVCEVGEFSFTE